MAASCVGGSMTMRPPASTIAHRGIAMPRLVQAGGPDTALGLSLCLRHFFSRPVRGYRASPLCDRQRVDRRGSQELSVDPRVFLADDISSSWPAGPRCSTCEPSSLADIDGQGVAAGNRGRPRRPWPYGFARPSGACGEVWSHRRGAAMVTIWGAIQALAALTILDVMLTFHLISFGTKVLARMRHRACYRRGFTSRVW